MQHPRFVDNDVFKAVQNNFCLFFCDSQVACPIVAALLHYFLLALFSWMLCEGVLHYILIVKVLGGGAQDKVKYLYMFGWGKRA